MLKSIVMMGGFFQQETEGVDTTEWNVKCDYHAADIVYNASVPVHRSVGIEITSQVTMNLEEFKNSFSADIFKPLQDYVQHWYQYSQTVTFHDPLAAATIFNDKICRFTKGEVNIELSNPGKLGITKWKADPGGKHEIAFSVDNDIFFEEYFSMFIDNK